MSHRHVEAFALMWYACKDGCHRCERIWNSRDGVTPFGMQCPDCGGNLLHWQFNLDVYAPNHTLYLGQRFWRNGTPEEAVAIMRRRIEAMDGKDAVRSVESQQLLEQARRGQLSEFRVGWPMLDICMEGPRR